jgi:hypothetical protein
VSVPEATINYRRRHDTHDVLGDGLTVDGQPVLDTKAVGAILGVKPKTISQYLVESNPGGRYASHPFPTPHGRIGNSPYWLPGQTDEIRQWDATRVGQGKGGGRPRKNVT